MTSAPPHKSITHVPHFTAFSEVKFPTGGATVFVRPETDTEQSTRTDYGGDADDASRELLPPR